MLSLLLLWATVVGRSTASIQVTIEEMQPTGVRFTVPDQGYSMVGLHYSLNKPVSGVAAGDANVDIRTKSGNSFVFEDPSIQLKPGDVINYWLLAIDGSTNQGLQALDQSYTYSGPTTISTTTTTTASTTTTAARVIKPAATTLTDILNPEGADTGGYISTVPPGPVGDNYAGASPEETLDPNGRGGNEAGEGPTAADGGGEGCTTVCNCKGEDSYNKESSCTSYPCLIFEDEFNTLDTKLWEHEITAGGGGNWEFQYYTNNRSNAYVRDGKLFIKPTLTTERFGPQFLEHGSLSLWGGNPSDTCTGNQFYGCERQGIPGQVVNPIQSARLRSSTSFNFRFGRLEVEAKMPTGDWLWPAIWLLPRWNAYGTWPASGEIDIVESRGNLHYKDDKGQPAGLDSMGSTLHFGPFVEANQWSKAHATTTASSGTFADSFHKYVVEWDDKAIRFSVDGKEILKVDPGPGGFWKFGDFEKEGQGKWDNPWSAGGHMAPFDQEFYIIMNVAVGGVGFFPDNYVNSPYPKPWNDHAGHAATAFWNARNNWLPTWKLDQDNGEGAAMQIKYVRVWKMGPSP